VRAATSIQRTWLDAPGNAELHPTAHHPRGAAHQFDEQRVRKLVIQWQTTGQCSRLLNEILLLSQPLLTGVVLSRGVSPENLDETVHHLRIKIWRKLRSFDCERGRLFSFLTMVVHQGLDELQSRERIHQQRYGMVSAGILEQMNRATLPEVRKTEIVNDLNWRVRQLKSTVTDPFELEAQRWLVNGLVATEFGLYRHQAADSMSIVYGLSRERSRTLYDLTLLEVRRTLLDVVEIPAVSRSSLCGTRGKALRRYADQLDAGDFSRLVFLMKNLAPIIIPKTDRIDLILGGFPNSQPLFPSEFGSTLADETRHCSQTRP
jgi:Sigma-70 region 2